jgi:hypothetical protein
MLQCSIFLIFTVPVFTLAYSITLNEPFNKKCKIIIIPRCDVDTDMYDTNINKDNNKITEIRTILQRERQNS